MPEPSDPSESPAGAPVRMVLVAAGLGVAVVILLLGFEYVGIEGTAWLWNDVLDADHQRWRALPIALVGGLALTAACVLTRNPRVPSMAHDVAAEFDAAPPRPGALAGILLVGAVSLLAGASLGPEASLMAAAATLGAFAAHRFRLGAVASPMVVATIGALLVAFLGSLILLAVPLVILWRAARSRGGRLGPVPVVLVVVAGLAAYGTGWLLERLLGHGGAYGTVPTLAGPRVPDYLIAAAMGLLAGLLAGGLTGLTQLCARWSTAAIARLGAAGPWLLGAVAGALLGVMYAVADPSVRFSGSLGSEELLAAATSFGVPALLGLVLVKVAVTALSKGSGYRGGMVFPAIYTGLALGLLIGKLTGLGGAGVVVGAMAGMLVPVIGGPLLGGIVLVAILPPRWWPLAAAAIVGTFAADAIGSWLRRRAARRGGSAPAPAADRTT